MSQSEALQSQLQDRTSVPIQRQENLWSLQQARKCPAHDRICLTSRTCVPLSMQFPGGQHLLPDNNFTNLPSPWIECVGVCISNWIQMSCQGANHYCPSLWNSVAFQKHKILKHHLESDMQIHIHSYIS